MRRKTDLRKGDSGEKGDWIQTEAEGTGIPGGEPTGHLMRRRRKALMEFQRDHGLLETGMADEITMKVLETAQESVQSRNGPG